MDITASTWVCSAQGADSTWWPQGAGTTGVMTGAEAQGQGWEEGETAAKGNLTGVIISPDRRFLSVWSFLLDGQGLWIH